MNEEPKDQSQPGGAGAAIAKGPELIREASKPQAPRGKTIVARMKSWSWRLTAVYVWVHWLARLFLGSDIFSSVETALTNKAVAVLSSFGFAPAKGEYLGRILKWGWLLLIASFSPQQLLWFAIYILVFPITLLLFYLFRDAINEAQGSQDDRRPGLIRKRAGIPFRSVATFLLAAWFVLYGSTASQRPTSAGLVISGVLFVLLGYSAFQKVAPIHESDAGFFLELAQAGRNLISNALKNAAEQPPKTKGAAATSLRVNGLFEKFFRFWTFFFRGRRGRDRVAVIVLTEYIFDLLMLGLSAVLFWGFAIRASVGASNVSLLAALKVSSSHFLPGVNIDAQMSLPWWADFGPAVTAWVLFVLYVGPAASMLRRNQEEFVRATGRAYCEFRQIALKWALYRRLMKKLQTRLP